MTLIKSISGIRGIIGGKPGTNLTPIDVVKFTTAFGIFITKGQKNSKIVIGRDARLSGSMVSGLVSNTLIGLGIDVVDLDLSTTPTVELAVVLEKASGGIIITASHNPKQWNALKLLNAKGEFISGDEGQTVLDLAETNDFEFAKVDNLGKYTRRDDYIDIHIEHILKLKLVDKEAIKKKNFRIAVDAVNSCGGFAVPKLLEKLGVKTIFPINCEPTGEFAHNPEPLPENLNEISEAVVKHEAHLGIVVDPDVDRLAIVNEDGSMFGEEYTLVAVADYVLSKTPGNTVSNLSSTRSLKDITVKRGGEYFTSAVGEVNVVVKMKEVDAVIGGEGNGGIIYPESHYGRDALVGIALFLSALAHSNKLCSIYRGQFPNRYISKNKIELKPEINLEKILAGIAKKYAKEQLNTEDGLRIDFTDEWVHLRKSNTEPIIRIYAEADYESKANMLAEKIITDIKGLI